MGLRTVRLGNTIHERLHGNPMSTTDIVGFSDETKLIVLVGCTVTDPPDADFDKLIRTRDELAESIGGTDSVNSSLVLIGLLVTIGGMAARNKDKLQEVEFVKGRLIDQYIMDTIATSPYRDKIGSTINEAYIHRDADWEFVIEMGKRLETNFGFMFDWTTGELYTKDDPRRR